MLAWETNLQLPQDGGSGIQENWDQVKKKVEIKLLVGGL